MNTRIIFKHKDTSLFHENRRLFAKKEIAFQHVFAFLQFLLGHFKINFVGNTIDKFANGIRVFDILHDVTQILEQLTSVGVFATFNQENCRCQVMKQMRSVGSNGLTILFGEEQLDQLFETRLGFTPIDKERPMEEPGAFFQCLEWRQVFILHK
jgi:hypothetical protein